MKLLDEIRNGAKWVGKDSFPSTPLWEAEVDKWLVFIKDHGQFERFLPRLKGKPDKRNEAFTEINTAYFTSEIMGYPIVEWEPQGANNKIGEFSFLVSDVIVFCEVKSPGWEADIARQDKLSPRLKKPKYIHGEGGPFKNSFDIRHAIEKAYAKFLPDKVNLLVLADDLMVSLMDDRLGTEITLFREKLKPPYHDTEPDGCFANDTFKKLSGLATLNIVHTDRITYHCMLYKNPHALCTLPDIFSRVFIHEVKN